MVIHKSHKIRERERGGRREERDGEDLTCER